jgi:antitoxin MazE6
MKLRYRVLNLIKKKYSGAEEERFGPTLDAGHLTDGDGLWSITRLAPLDVGGAPVSRQKGKKHCQRRERKEHFGRAGAAGWAEVEMKLNDALARNWSCGYTLGMKTAISIPNDLFDGAERLARRTRRSRSRLFTDALREYLARHAPDKVTESMDQAIMEVGEGRDEFVSSVARRRLERTEW